MDTNIRFKHENRMFKKVHPKNYPSHRELVILDRLSRGRVCKQIADEMSISEATVRKHLQNSFRKIGVTKETEASRWITEFQNSIIHFKK